MLAFCFSTCGPRVEFDMSSARRTRAPQPLDHFVNVLDFDIADRTCALKVAVRSSAREGTIAFGRELDDAWCTGTHVRGDHDRLCRCPHCEWRLGHDGDSVVALNGSLNFRLPSVPQRQMMADRSAGHWQSATDPCAHAQMALLQIPALGSFPSAAFSWTQIPKGISG